ncbi:MAG: hypothetical protein QNK05_02675 [Myxococcota bacterium]|nr:hypothetical protein [Myxococcota bacterium]
MPGFPTLPVRALFFALLISASAQAQTPSFITFETGPVRPIGVSEDGNRVFVVNTPDARLEVFAADAVGLTHTASIPVGLEPDALAVRGNDEVWVVNHLSDSVSIVDVTLGRVKKTLLVGDEPRDIVFANDRAFITTAHRGQHRTDASVAGVPGVGDPQLTTPGVGRADVWVFDADAPGDSLGGDPVAVLTLFADTPRALAVSPDGGTVYAAAFHSGNQTTVISEGLVCNGFDPATPCQIGPTPVPGGNPGPATNHEGVPAPEVGIIVRLNPATGKWEDELGRDWSAAVRFDLPDKDVFAIDAETLQTTEEISGVGTILFNMVANPRTGAIYVSNTEARNEVRFEGPGEFFDSTVQGRLHESRITVIKDGQVLPRHLNKHIDYDVRPAPPGTKDHSLATPLDMVIDKGGRFLYVAAFGSSKIGVYRTSRLENDSFDPETASARHIDVSGGGPSGLVIDDARRRLYVATRFDNGVSVVDLRSLREVDHVSLHNPEPDSVVAGRPVLYDAFNTSSNGEASCSSCHVFGDLDSLAWDLGDPDGGVGRNPMVVNLDTAVFLARDLFDADFFSGLNGEGNLDDFSPMKGPMTTQTFRGMVNSGHMHWRGDRADGFFGFDAGNTNDSELSFKNFIVAFPGLLGSERSVNDADLQQDMQAFTDFTLQIALPPNPIRNLDNSDTPAQARGRDFFFGGPDGTQLSDGLPLIPGATGFTCNGCHDLDPSKGFFGTGGDSSFEFEEQTMKVPHMRNLYQKVGMFGMAPVPNFFLFGDNGHQGDQIRGFGFLHDGSSDTLFRFFRSIVFDPDTFSIPEFGIVGGGFTGGNPQRRDMEAFALAFPSDLAPIVGQQVTLTATSGADVDARVQLLMERAEAPFTSKFLGGDVTECDLIAKTSLLGAPRGYFYTGAGTFLADDGSTLSDAELRAIADTNDVTYTCMPPGSGMRAGVDRDEDDVLDGLDNCPAVANAGQADGDVDGLGDACDDANALVLVASSGTGACGLGFEAVLPLAAAFWMRRRRTLRA